MMKTLKIVTILLTLLLFFSCKSDDNDDNSTEIELIGKWKPTKYIVDYQNGTMDIDIPDECDSESILRFNPNGTFSDYSCENNSTCECVTFLGTWEFIENELFVVENDDMSEQVSNYYEITNNILRLGEIDNGVIYYGEFERIE